MALDVFTPLQTMKIFPELLVSVANIFGYEPAANEGIAVESTKQELIKNEAQFALRGLGGGKEGSGALKSPKTGKAKLHELAERAHPVQDEKESTRQGTALSHTSHNTQGFMEPLRIGDEEHPESGSNSHRTVGRTPPSSATGNSRGHGSEPSYSSGGEGHGASHGSGGGSHGGGSSGGYSQEASEKSGEGKVLEELLKQAKRQHDSSSDLKQGENAEQEKSGPEGSTTADSNSISTDKPTEPITLAPAKATVGSVMLPAEPVAPTFENKYARVQAVQGGAVNADGTIGQAGFGHKAKQVNADETASPYPVESFLGSDAGAVGRPAYVEARAQARQDGGRSTNHAGHLIRGGKGKASGSANPNSAGQPAQGGAVNEGGAALPTEGWTPGQPVPVPPKEFLDHFKRSSGVADSTDDPKKPNPKPKGDDRKKGAVPPPPNSAPPPLDLGDLEKDSTQSSRPKKISVSDIPGSTSDTPSSSDSGPDLIEVPMTDEIRDAAQLLEFDLDTEYPKLHEALYVLRQQHTNKTFLFQGVLDNLIAAKEKELGRDLNPDEFEELINNNRSELEKAGEKIKELDDALETVKKYYNGRYAIGKNKAKTIAGNRGENDKYAGISVKDLEQKLKELNGNKRHLEDEAADAFQDEEKISFDDRPYDLVAEELEKVKIEALALRRYITKKIEEEKKKAEKSGKAKPQSKAALKIEKKAQEERVVIERDHNKLLRFFDALLPVGQQKFRTSAVKVLYNSTSGEFMPERKDGVYSEEKNVPLVSLLEELSEDQLNKLYNYMMTIEAPARLNVITYAPNYTIMLEHVFPPLPRAKAAKKEITEDRKEELARRRAKRRKDYYRYKNGGQQPEQAADGASSSTSSGSSAARGKLSAELMKSFQKFDHRMADQVASGNTSLSRNASPAKPKTPKRGLAGKAPGEDSLMDL